MSASCAACKASKSSVKLYPAVHETAYGQPHATQCVALCAACKRASFTLRVAPGTASEREQRRCCAMCRCWRRLMLPNSAMSDAVLCASCALGFDPAQPLYAALDSDNNSTTDNNSTSSTTPMSMLARVGESDLAPLSSAELRQRRVRDAIESAFVRPLCAHDKALVAHLLVAYRNVLATAASASSRSQWHWFVSGPPASGKTTFALLLAHAVRLSGALSGAFGAPVVLLTAAKLIDEFGKGGLGSLLDLLDAARGGVLVVDNAHELPARELLTRHLADQMGDEASGKQPLCSFVFVGLDAESSSHHHLLQLDEAALRVGSRVPATRRIALAAADWTHLTMLLRRKFDAHDSPGRSLLLRHDFAELAHDEALWQRTVPLEMETHCGAATHRRLGLRLANEWYGAVVAARDAHVVLAESALDDAQLRNVALEELIAVFKSVR